MYTYYNGLMTILIDPVERMHELLAQLMTAPSCPLAGDLCCFISNGNRTEWSPIRSVIIRVINKIGRPRSESPICLITSMITDRIGRHEVLLPINSILCIILYFLRTVQLIINFVSFLLEFSTDGAGVKH